jgi:hypothetical protein
MHIMTTYKILRGTLSLGAAGTWGVQSGGVVFDYPACGWRAYLNGSETVNMGPPYADCNLTVDLEGGGELRGVCSLVELDVLQAQVESGCQPDEFVEPTIIEAE